MIITLVKMLLLRCIETPYYIDHASLYNTRHCIDIMQYICIYFRVQKELGSGNFGCVMQCIYSESPTHQLHVAAKTLKQSCDTVDKIRFLQEAAIMGQFHHKNIVKLYGVVVDETPVNKCTCYETICICEPKTWNRYCCGEDIPFVVAIFFELYEVHALYHFAPQKLLLSDI